MKSNKIWNPDGIACHLDDDGLVSESLFGFHTRPGKTPIDDLIMAVEALWLEWDLQDPKFIKLATKILGSMPGNNQIIDMIKASSQSQELKDALINMTMKGMNAPKAPIINTKNPSRPKNLLLNQTIKWKPHRDADTSGYRGPGSVTFRRSGGVLDFDNCCGPLPVSNNPSLHYWEFINEGPWKYSNQSAYYPINRVHTKYMMVGNVWPNVKYQTASNPQGMRYGTYVLANRATVRTALSDNITSLVIGGKKII
jgi:hypothetical protein